MVFTAIIDDGKKKRIGSLILFKFTHIYVYIRFIYSQYFTFEQHWKIHLKKENELK